MENKLISAMEETVIKLRRDFENLIKQEYIAYAVEAGGVIAVVFPQFSVTVDFNAQIDSRKLLH